MLSWTSLTGLQPKDKGREGGSMAVHQYMRRAFYLFTIIVLAVSLISPAAAYEGSQGNTAKHFLWSVHSGPRTVYLLGSIHLLKKESYPLPAAIDRIARCCGKLAFETDLDGMSDPAMQIRVMKRGMYPPGQGLSNNIAPETYALLREKLAGMGVPAAQIEPLRPWLAAQTIASSALLSLGFDPAFGIDRYFFERAKKEGKETLFLETNEFQINLFAGLGSERQDILLKQTLKELDVIEENFSVMVDAWEKGDDGRLGSFIEESFKGYPDLYRRFVTERNRKWVAKIQRWLKGDHDVLLIVGAAHLAGKGSLQELLEKKGYTIRQR